MQLHHAQSFEEQQAVFDHEFIDDVKHQAGLRPNSVRLCILLMWINLRLEAWLEEHLSGGYAVCDVFMKALLQPFTFSSQWCDATHQSHHRPGQRNWYDPRFAQCAVKPRALMVFARSAAQRPKSLKTANKMQRRKFFSWCWFKVIVFSCA